MENNISTGFPASGRAGTPSLASASSARRFVGVPLVSAPLPEQAGQRGAKNSRRSPGPRWRIGSVSLDPRALASLGSLGISYCVLSAHYGAVSAAGVLAIIGVHELGHILAARLFGVHMHWPIFVPLVGAFVTIERGGLYDPYKNACIGIAGPLAGVAATLVLHWVAIRCGSEDLKEAVRFGYAAHLFNLIPAGMLDGGHVAEFVGRWLWVPGAVLLGWMVFQMRDSPWYTLLMLAMIMVPAMWRAVVVVLRWCGLADKITPARGMGGKRAAMFAVALVVVAVCTFGLFLLAGRR